MTDQEHADAIRKAAADLDAAIRAAFADGLCTHVMKAEEEPSTCGFITTMGIAHVDVVRPIKGD